jgi:hypothetical protein
MPTSVRSQRPTDRGTDLRTDRLAELVAHLVGCEQGGAREVLDSAPTISSSAEEALRLAAHAVVELRGASATLRVAPYLGRASRHRHEHHPVPGPTAAGPDRFDLRVRHVAHRQLLQRNRPTGFPGPGRTVAG